MRDRLGIPVLILAGLMLMPPATLRAADEGAVPAPSEPVSSQSVSSRSVLAGLLARLPPATSLAQASPAALRAAARSLALERAAEDPDALAWAATLAGVARADAAGRAALVGGLLDGARTLAEAGRLAPARLSALESRLAAVVGPAPPASPSVPLPTSPSPGLAAESGRPPSPYPQPPGYRPPYAPPVGIPDTPLMGAQPVPVPVPSAPVAPAIRQTTPPGVARPDPRSAASGF